MGNITGRIIAIDRSRNVFRLGQNDTLVRVSTGLTAQEHRIQGLSGVQYYKTPFVAIAAAKPDGNIISSWRLSPNTFYPLSPFDYADAVIKYSKGEPLAPLSIAVDLTDRCNFACKACFARGKREKAIPGDVPTQAYFETIDFIRSFGNPLNQIISGGGEPSVHPDFAKILARGGKLGLTAFLSTNGSRTDQEFIDSVAANTQISVFSVQGIHEEAFRKVTRAPIDVTLSDVLKTIERVINRRDELGRKDEMLVGVNSLVYPENTGHYEEFVGRLVDIGIDFVHFNPIFPNTAKFGIVFGDDEKKIVADEMARLLEKFRLAGTYIRVPELASRDKGTYYFDPHVRKNPEVCFISLLMPSIIPTLGVNGQGTVVSCRFHPNVIDDPKHWFTSSLGRESFRDIWTRSNIDRIQQETAKCDQCGSERQFMALDWMLYAIRRSSDAGFYLLFDEDKETLGSTTYRGSIERSYPTDNLNGTEKK